MAPRTPFFVALVAVVVMFCAFLAGIVDVLDSSAGFVVFWRVMFVASGIALLGSFAAAIVNLVKRRDRVISVATLLVPVVPTALIAIVATVG